MKTPSKILLIFLIFTICFSTGAGLFYPKKAKALVVFDPANLGQWVADAARQLQQYALDLAQWAWEQRNSALKMAMAAFRKALLDMIVNEIVEWIQGGGDPKFVTDWESFLKDAVDVAGASALEELIGKSLMNELCYGDWGLAINIALSSPQTFENNVTCTLDDIAANFEDFTNNFHNGGWEAWIKTTTENRNNPYGLYLVTLSEKQAREAEAKEAAALRASSGSGFLGDRICKQQVCVDDDTGEKTTMAGSFSENEVGADCWCEIWEERSPGKIVADSLSESLFSDVKWLQENEEWESYVIAISDAIVNRLVTEGISAITSDDVGSSGSSSGVSESEYGSEVLSENPPTTTLSAYDSWSVQITSDEDVIIYYTTDGTEPTVSSNLYYEPISLDGDTTIKWFGMDYSLNQEEVQTEFLTPPFSAEEVGLSTKAQPTGTHTISIISNTPAFIYYTTNGETPTTSSTRYMQTITMSDTEYLQWIAITADGEQEGVQGVYTITPYGSENFSPDYDTIFDFVEPTASFFSSGSILDASESKDNDDTDQIAMYEWDFDNDGTYDIYVADWDRDGIFDEALCPDGCSVTGDEKTDPDIGNDFVKTSAPSISEEPWQIEVYFSTSESKTVTLRVTDDEGLTHTTTGTITSREYSDLLR